MGTKEDERLMRSTTSAQSGTFLVRESDEGRLALCVMLVTDDGEHVVEKHHILDAREEGNVDAACRLVNKSPDGDVSEERFENLDELVWNKRHQLRLRHSFLKAESPPMRNGQPLPDVIDVATRALQHYFTTSPEAEAFHRNLFSQFRIKMPISQVPRVPSPQSLMKMPSNITPNPNPSSQSKVRIVNK